MFQLKSKDLMGRIGEVETRHGKIETPAIYTVINPNKQIITPKELREEFGINLLITNSYIIYKNEKLREEALEKGVHKMLDFDGAIMTDSGAFQLMVYGDIDVDNEKIMQFQKDIGVDIGVMLDIPAHYSVDKEIVKKNIETTFNRAEKVRDFVEQSKTMWNLPIQGGMHKDLVEYSAKRALDFPEFKLNPLGSVVPLMNDYYYDKVVEGILTTKKYLNHKPLHLFGAGHPMFFALPVALGIDFFDSAAYALFAKGNRYLTVRGTKRLEELDYLPCNCPICSKYTAKELNKDKDKERLLAKHNLHVTLSELNLCKQAIREGTLWDLVEERATSHPKMLKAFKVLKQKEYSGLIEKYDPSSKKKAFNTFGEMTLIKPEVSRHQEKFKNNYSKKHDTVIILKDTIDSPYFKSRTGNRFKKYLDRADVLGVIYPFGLTNLGVDEHYPLAQQCHTKDYHPEGKQKIKEHIESFLEKHNYKKILYLKNNLFEINGAQEFEKSSDLENEISKIKPKEELSKQDIDKIFIENLINYEYGPVFDKVINKKELVIDKSKKTQKIRKINQGKEYLGTYRPNDMVLIPSFKFSEKLNKVTENKKVIIDKDSIPFVKDGKSVFSKFVVKASEDIRANDEIFIIDEENNFIANGQAILSQGEMGKIQKGTAVKTREKE